MKLETLDVVLFTGYVVALLVVAWWVSRDRKGHLKDTNDYFLAGNSLPWWAIGASLIAANISAEQIIGMSGSGYVIGLAIASYEWMAAITLMIVGKYFLPLFIKHRIYTMPQFLEQRYDHRVRTVLAIFWLGVYIFVNLTAVLWLGALAIHTISGVGIGQSMVLLGLFSLAYSLYGGLKAVAMTDIIQVVMLIVGGLFLVHISLNLISDGGGVVQGFKVLTAELPGKFDMILDADHPNYKDLPGLSVLIGGLWVMNVSYWGFNQYIIQRTLAAKNISEAQKGIAFAAFLKLLMPVIVVLPGIAAALLVPGLGRPDEAYPSLVTLLPVGIKGLILAALVAAIVSSLASMCNSISTIFTLDLYSKVKTNASQGHYVLVGRMVSVLALCVAMLVAKPLLSEFDQAFQYIQEFTGFFTPGIVVLFLLGMFYPKTTANAGLIAAVSSAVLSIVFKLFWPSLPFMDRVGLVFVVCIAIALLISQFGKSPTGKSFSCAKGEFATSLGFNVSTLAVVLILIGFYATWW